MSQERLLAKIKEYAKENNIDLDAASPNEHWLNWFKAEIAVRKLFPELVDDGPKTQAVNSEITRKVSELISKSGDLRNLIGLTAKMSKEQFDSVVTLPLMKKIAKDSGLDLTKKFHHEKVYYLALSKILEALKSAKENAPVKVRVSFSKQPAVRLSYDDLIAEWLSGRQLSDTPQNRTTAKKFYTDLAAKRGMTTLDPGLLRMSDATFENYVSLLRY